MQRLLHILVVLVLLVVPLPACKQVVPVMNLYGFTVLRPPSNLYQAGAVVAIEWEEKDGVPAVVGLKLVCGPRASLGPNWMPVQSATLTSTTKTSSKQSWHIEGEALDKIRSRTDLSNVKDVAVTLENARIVEVQDTDIYENVKYRSAECTQAITARIKAKFYVTMVSSNIVADITYNVLFSHDYRVDKTAKSEQMQNLAITLGGGHTYVDEHMIQAQNLAVGIKTDTFLLAASLPDEHLRTNVQDTRELDAQEADADATPDAPVVHPPGGPPQRIRGPNLAIPPHKY